MGESKLLVKVPGSVEETGAVPAMVSARNMLFFLLACALSDLISSISSSGCSKVGARPGLCTLGDLKTLHFFMCRVVIGGNWDAIAYSANANGSRRSISDPWASPWISFGSRSWLEVHDW